MATAGKAQFVISAVDNATSTVRNLNRRMDRMTEPVQRLRNSLRALGTQLGFRRLGQQVGRMRERFGGLTSSVGGLIVKLGVAGAAAGGFFYSLQQTSQGMDKVLKLSERLGVNVEWLQRMQYAAGQAAIPQRTFNMALQRFQRRAAEAAAGSGEAQEALEYLGIELKNADGTMRPTEELFGEVADAIAGVEDPALRTRIAFKLFDSQGVAMINMLRDGSGALDEASTRADELGRVLDEKALRASQRFNDSWDDLTSITDGLWRQLVADLLPTITKIVRQITDWYTANRELVRDKVADFAKRVAAGIQEIARWIGENLPKVQSLIESLGGLKGIFKGIALVIGASFVASLVSVAAALGGLAVSAAGIVASLGGIVTKMPAALNALRGLNGAASGALGKVGGVLGKAGALGAAGAGGYAIGTVINENVIEGTKLGDSIGRGVAQVLSFFGNDQATAALEAERRANERRTVTPNGPTNQRTQVGGKVTVEIRGRDGRVREIRSDNPDVPIDVDSGPMPVAP